MNNVEFAKKCEEVLKYKTVYASGTFGQKATPSTINAKAKQYPKWYSNSRVNYLLSLPDDTRMFDCCGLIKGVAWGFPDTVYTSNGCPDVNDQGLWNISKDKSEYFSKIQVGELLWMPGHVGLYIGNGKGIECTTAWENKVQITAVANIGSIPGLHSRTWKGHAKLPFVSYDSEAKPEPVKPDYSQYPVLSYGSRSEYVKILQKLLLDKGYDCKGIDGVWGKNTNSAVLRFQRENKDIYGRQLKDDACVGPLTWGALYK